MLTTQLVTCKNDWSFLEQPCFIPDFSHRDLFENGIQWKHDFLND